MKRVVILNLSDCRGGAAVVSRRLLHALVDAGVNAHMLVAHKGTDDPRVVVAAPAWRYKIPFLEEAADIYLHNGRCRSDIFKVSTGRYGLPLSRHPLVAQADAVILAWVNQGFCSFADIRRMARNGKRLLWVMHDMWNLTGICHHAGDCRAYERPEGCSACPMLHTSAGPHDLSARTWAAKAKLYAETHIGFVAVSSWLAERCRRSPLFAGQELHTIGNAFPVDEFYTEPRRSRASLGLPPKGKIILMGAARLDDPVKGLPFAVETLNIVDYRINAHNFAGTDKLPPVTAVFFGDLRDPHALDRLRLPHEHLGTVDGDTARELYAHADVVLSTSLYETLPGTLIEGQAAGAVPVTFDRGGQGDIIRSDAEGRLVAFGNAPALADALMETLTTPSNPAALRAAAARFSAPTIASQFLPLL